MPAPPAGLRERKKQATRTALSEAALRLSVRHGVAGVTVEQIAEVADVSARTFFNYFASKEEAIVAADTTAGGRRLCLAVAERDPSEPITVALREALRSLVTGPEEPRREWIAELRLVRSTPALLPHHIAAHVATERALAEVIAKRTGTDPDADRYPALAAAATVAAMRVSTNRWLDTGGDTSLADEVVHAFDQLADGLATPRAP